MINAGIEALCSYEPEGDSIEDAVIWIFSAMYEKISETSAQDVPLA